MIKKIERKAEKKRKNERKKKRWGNVTHNFKMCAYHDFYLVITFDLLLAAPARPLLERGEVLVLILYVHNVVIVQLVLTRVPLLSFALRILVWVFLASFLAAGFFFWWFYVIFRPFAVFFCFIWFIVWFVFCIFFINRHILCVFVFFLWFIVLLWIRFLVIIGFRRYIFRFCTARWFSFIWLCRIFDCLFFPVLHFPFFGFWRAVAFRWFRGEEVTYILKIKIKWHIGIPHENLEKEMSIM